MDFPYLSFNRTRGEKEDRSTLIDSARESSRLKFIVARKEEIICTGRHLIRIAGKRARPRSRRGKLREKGYSSGSPRTNLSRVRELLFITGLIYSLNIQESCRSWNSTRDEREPKKFVFFPRTINPIYLARKILSTLPPI